MALRRAFLQKVSSSPYDPELITNGNFDSDASGWSGFTGSATITYDAGKGKVQGNGAAGQQFAIVNGDTYKVKVDISKIGGLSIVTKIFIGVAAGGKSYYESGFLADGSIDFNFTAPATNAATYFQFYIYGSSNPFNIDNVSIKKVL